MGDFSEMGLLGPAGHGCHLWVFGGGVRPSRWVTTGRNHVPCPLPLSNVGPDGPSRVYIAVEPAQLLKGDVMVSACPRKPCSGASTV